MRTAAGIECSILADGQLCDEYRVQESDSNGVGRVLRHSTTSAHIQLDPGLHFDIVYVIKGEFSFQDRNALLMELLIDGRKLTDRVVTNDEARDISAKLSKVEYYRHGGWFSRSFWTYKLKVSTSSQSMRGLETRYPGQIEVRWSRIYATRSSQPPGNLSEYSKVISRTNRRIPRRILNDQFVEVRAGICEVERPEYPIQVFASIASEDREFARFVFHYRSGRALEAIGILKEVPLRDPSEMTLAELREEVRRRRQRSP